MIVDTRRDVRMEHHDAAARARRSQYAASDRRHRSRNHLATGCPSRRRDDRAQPRRRGVRLRTPRRIRVAPRTLAAGAITCALCQPAFAVAPATPTRGWTRRDVAIAHGHRRQRWLGLQTLAGPLRAPLD